jgi:carbonic anhydrase/acetyltransferase-like protein (isoleucine patch superfamily)
MPAEPAFGEGVFIAPSAQVQGDVHLSNGANVWFGSLVDGTDGPVELAEAANVQDNCQVRGVAGHQTSLGHRAAMGHNARLLGGVVEDRVLIAIGATVLPGAHVGTYSIIAANATVPEGMVVPPRSLVIGQGRIVREVTEAEMARIERTGNEYLRLASEYLAQHGEPARPKGPSL